MLVEKTPEAVLSTVFGYDSFKPLQREVIDNVLRKRDTLAIMPTGGGKSLCYQIPALIFPGLTVVVSPLIALMKDQVEQLQAAGVPALFLNSSLSFEEYQANMQRVRSGEVRLLYVAPETLLTPRLVKLLADLPVDCLTIDEAHCISEWGHDFRPEYRQLAAVRERFPHAVCLALTATATERVRADIKAALGFQDANQFITSFNRENLRIEVAAKTDPAAQTIEFVQRFPNQAGIIYCFSRKQVDDLAGFLAARGYSVRPYHAGLDDAARRDNQEAFVRDDAQIIVATIAFGMGINKPNVRFVLHYDLPKSLEGYYQEIGRAGRDGLPADCLLLYSYGDVAKLRYFIDQREAAERQMAYQHLNALIHYAEIDTCRRVPLLAYFGEEYSEENCGMCDNCLKEAGTPVDITIPAQKFLSCVIRTGERFAAAHVTQVLLGSENERILKFGHQNLSTYGIGADLTRRQWLHLAHQLVQQGLLARSSDMYQTLRLTPRGYEILKNREPVMGFLLEEAPARRKGARADDPDYDRELFDLLRQKRKALADDAQVPPYVIFSDRTLVDMAASYPMSAAALRKVHGVGQVKAERYGPTFIELIRAYCEPRSLSEKAPLRSGGAQTEVGKPRQVEVGEAYNQGETILALMARYQVQLGTIVEHLTRYALEGNSLRPADELAGLVAAPADLQTSALAAFAELGPAYLKPVFDRLEGAVGYEDLKLLRVIHLSQA